jgi:hypothetical protein
MRARLVTMLLASVVSVGCAKSAPSTSTSAPTAKATTTTAKEEAPKQKNPRMGDSAVYVDGKSVAVMRYLELPPTVQPITRKTSDGYEITRYGLASYFKALGIDMAKVKGAHFFGGRRCAFVGGDELRSLGDELKFSFTMKDRGKPRIHRAHKMQADLSIDMLTGLVVYVEKEPPTLREDAEGTFLFYPDGKKVDGVPYANEEQGNGTRVYVDGKLAATLKRKTLSNKALIPGDDAHPHFSLAAYLDSVGIDAKQAKTIDFVAGDDVVARQGTGSKLTFTLPAKSQGKAVFEVPKANADGQTASTRISAIELYVHSNPPARTVTPPEQDDVPGQGNGAGQGGRQDDEG